MAVRTDDWDKRPVIPWCWNAAISDYEAQGLGKEPGPVPFAVNQRNGI